MKLPSTLIVLITICLLSCNNDELFLPLTPELVKELKAYDLDNNGNSSDIRLEFEVVNNLNVLEYRVMIVPVSLSGSFDVLAASAVPSSSYLEVLPKSFENTYGFNRLPAGINDVTGTSIKNNADYVIAVFTIGSDENQLSEYFSEITLKDQSIYAGRYMLGANYIDLSSSDGILFSGILRFFCQDDSGCNLAAPGTIDIPFGRVTILLVGEVVTEFTRDFPEARCNFVGCGELNVDICSTYDTGQGILNDEITFVINLTRDRCGLLTNELTVMYQRLGSYEEWKATHAE